MGSAHTYNYVNSLKDDKDNIDISTPNTQNNTLEEKLFVYSNIARATSENLYRGIHQLEAGQFLFLFSSFILFLP